VLKVPCSSIEESLGFWCTEVMPSFAKSAFFRDFFCDEWRAGVGVERVCRGWRGGPSSPLYGFIEEVNSGFNVRRRFKGNGKGQPVGD
jgi:hypothetical protein